MLKLQFLTKLRHNNDIFLLLEFSKQQIWTNLCFSTTYDIGKAIWIKSHNISCRQIFVIIVNFFFFNYHLQVFHLQIAHYHHFIRGGNPALPVFINNSSVVITLVFWCCIIPSIVLSWERERKNIFLRKSILIDNRYCSKENKGDHSLNLNVLYSGFVK